MSDMKDKQVLLIKKLEIFLRAGGTIDYDTYDVLDPEIQAALDAGDPAARAVLHRCGVWLGIGIASLAAMFSPRRIVLSGGLARLHAPDRSLAETARDEMQKFGAPLFVESVEVTAGSLGADAGVHGAAALALAQR